MDAKVGIGDAFTVDMTPVPDFGQVVWDNLVLNLSPYEVRLDENRPFFPRRHRPVRQGPRLFYSRRVDRKGNCSTPSPNSLVGVRVGIECSEVFARDTTGGAMP